MWELFPIDALLKNKKEEEDKMIDLVFGVHLYQPPNQWEEILEKITRESYLPLIEIILARDTHNKLIFTADIARSAIEGLEKINIGQEFLKKFKEALEIKKIFLVNTAAYHPILPLIPEEEVIRQVKLNETKLFQMFHQKPRGVFPPEMALDSKTIQTLGKMGYLWTIANDIPFSCVYGLPPFNWIPKQNKIAVFLRSDFWSNKIAFNLLSGKGFVKVLENELTSWFGGQDGYLMIWMDWETFGHHKKGFIEGFIIPFLNEINEKIHLVSPDYLLQKYPQKEIEIPSGTWSTLMSDFKKGNYWPLWKNPHNQFHQLWWELVEMVLKIKKDIKDEEILMVFDKALYSCQTWQYSMGNKSLAIKGVEYFREIASSEEVKANEKVNQINQIVDKLEKLCQ